jgi:SLA1 homology domain 1, SHD1
MLPAMIRTIGTRPGSSFTASAPSIPVISEPEIVTPAESATAVEVPSTIETPKPVSRQDSVVNGETAVLVKDNFNSNVWKVGDIGTATRMVNAPTSPQHIARYKTVIGNVNGINANTVAMLDDGSLRKVTRGATVTLVRINSAQTHPYVECAVEQSGERYSVFLVLEWDRQGELKFTAANDPVMTPPGDPAPAPVAKSAPARNAAPATRNWTSADGKFSTEAGFQGTAAGKVKLQKTDGSVITVDIEKLSEADQKWINQRAKISPPQERSVKFIFVGDYFSKSNRVRLLPVKVGKAEVRSGTVDTIKAKCLDPKDPFAHRWILGSDFEGDDRKWFGRNSPSADGCY